ncbi:protein FAR1-RELATED SEQUENCE 5-like [Lathyrus oleraceus]|uniref:protein FAR1-RELATED SEQUENCE 5-like n=1 Tax=Pisum sativum TaxID=3888 RepID=UPI0021CE854B|nr:protein FAR1-RELATED SEQUENCE 5-like [Pisum sativum]
MGIKYLKEIKKHEIHDFNDKHNHQLQLSETTHMLASQCKLSEVQAHEINFADDAGIKQKALFELMSRQVGGRENLGYTRVNQKNYLHIKRLGNMAYGEASTLLQHFQQKCIQNPSFYHGVQLDIEEQITNIFWTDARMIMDYEYFGDVVTLDITCSTNNTYRPLVVFAGFNHFRGVVIFGVALLYDETA